MKRYCSRCGAVVSAKVRDYSVRKYGLVWCFPCQNGGKKILGESVK